MKRHLPGTVARMPVRPPVESRPDPIAVAHLRSRHGQLEPRPRHARIAAAHFTAQKRAQACDPRQRGLERIGRVH